MTAVSLLHLFFWSLTRLNSRSRPWLLASTSGRRRPKVRGRVFKGGERGAKRRRAALECCAPFSFFRRRNFCTHLSSHTPPREVAFRLLFALAFCSIALHLASMGRAFCTLSAEKLESWRIGEIGGEREARIAIFFFLSFFSRAKEKKKSLENHKKGQKRVTEKAAVVGLLWIPRRAFSASVDSASV